MQLNFSYLYCHHYFQDEGAVHVKITTFVNTLLVIIVTPQATREACGSSVIPGKFHSGFLQRAKLFPIDKVLYDERFKDTEVVCCGHSLGGAIASIVAIRLQGEKARYKLSGDVKCVTFGAPLFGDSILQKAVDSNNMHHFVCYNDPVPYLLNYSQTISSVIKVIDNQISSLANKFSTQEGQSYHKNHIDDLLGKKGKYLEILSSIEPFFSSVFEIASIVYPGMKVINNLKNLLGIMNDMKLSTTEKQSVYTPIGNFYFLTDNGQEHRFFEANKCDNILLHFEKYYENHSEDITSDKHAVIFYKYALQYLSKPKVPFKNYYTYIEEAIHDEFFIPIPRKIAFISPYSPVIHSVKLVKVIGKENIILRLSFTGLHLFDIVLQLCQFHFNYPFASNHESSTVKKVSMGEQVQRVIIEEQFKEDLSISDHGSIMKFVTQFGICHKKISREDIRDIVIQSVKQIACHDSVSLVIRRAVQRGMALSKIKADAGSGPANTIIQELKELGNIAIGSESMKNVQTMFDDHKKDFSFMLSNEEAFEEIKTFSKKIENYLRSPMEIQAEQSIMQKVILGLTSAAGAVALGYLAGPGLVMVGLTTAASPGAATCGGLLGFMAGGAYANSMMNDQLTDSFYENALKWMNLQLLETQKQFLDENSYREILDLQDDGSIYSNERILKKLVDSIKENNLNICGNGILSNCTQKSKNIIHKRIEAVMKIHNIREIFAKQCFIGVVGIQDAGKTTLVRNIWGVGRKTGILSHTDVPLVYEITNKLIVVDFPGSNSLDYHAKTFSICGAMNNMVIVVIPFMGDVSKIVSDEIQNVFSVMKGSESTKVLLCINKCGPFLEQLREELGEHESPIGFLKKRFVHKLNENYESSRKGIIIKDDDILFTDWMIGDTKEAMDFGLAGVTIVKYEIKKYLVNNGIYMENDDNELQKCLAMPHFLETLT